MAGLHELVAFGPARPTTAALAVDEDAQGLSQQSFLLPRVPDVSDVQLAVLEREARA
jgi:hypothetical protein